jgi:hypothetical protein
MKSALLLLALAFVVVVSGCAGDEVLDEVSAEEAIQAELERSAFPPKSVDCPGGVDVKAGVKFECQVKLKGGGEKPAKLEITDEDADLRLLNGAEFEAEEG